MESNEHASLHACNSVRTAYTRMLHFIISRTLLSSGCAVGLILICSQVANLRQLHVHCGLPNILLTRSYEEFLVHQATGKIPDPQPPRPSLVFTSDDMLLNRVYFFMPMYVELLYKPSSLYIAIHVYTRLKLLWVGLES